MPLPEKRVCCTLRGSLKTLFEKEIENLALKDSELIRLALNHYLRNDKGNSQRGITVNTPANKS